MLTIVSFFFFSREIETRCRKNWHRLIENIVELNSRTGVTGIHYWNARIQIDNFAKYSLSLIIKRQGVNYLIGVIEVYIYTYIILSQIYGILNEINF